MLWLGLAIGMWAASQLPVGLLIGRAIRDMAGDHFDQLDEQDALP